MRPIALSEPAVTVGSAAPAARRSAVMEAARARTARRSGRMALPDKVKRAVSTP